ncbi:uncharacterized protein ATC70_004659 [Mucor velutinosus]|uniref:39S ribosomal protein L51, mitochondrial n=3 Tax=Mucor velutinosus TaxID=708070 RepID=A0AAN7DU19_9FUNG|nr:39S ribosomal protein L51, mitochondrial [Mucor velutinosus]KAK4522120.1 hypothetical protein ATC70_004659 [Mucor velutinosus]
MTTPISQSLQGFDISQLPMLLEHIQQQLASVQEKVHEHDHLLERMNKLEEENQALKKNLLAKDLVIQELQGQLSRGTTQAPTPEVDQERPFISQVVQSQDPATTASTTIATDTATKGSYLSAARSGAKRPDPVRTAKRRLAAGRLFQSAAVKGQQGYQYVYLGRSGKIQRSEVRATLRKVGVDTGRVLDICFPASGVIGVLVHIQYVDTFLAYMHKCEAELIENFEPLDPKHIADPQYANLAIADREQLIYEFTNTRALQTLSFLRPLNVSGVGKYFVSAGWISQEELDTAVSEAMGRLAEKEPKKAQFLLKLVHDVLSHVLDTHVLVVTETWLLSGSFPSDWSQFHLYGTKVPGAFGRGSGGVTAFVSPSCPFSVSQLPSYNPHTLSLKVGTLTVHCVYLPPPLSSDKVLSLLRSLPITSDTILCGDFNARFGSLLGDTTANPRGNSLLPWIEEASLSILNESLAYGTPTFTTFRRQQEVHSIIDLFLTNIGETAMLNSQLVVDSDLSLGSDHRLMVLTFEYVPPPDDTLGSGNSGGLAPRRQWKLSKLRKKRPLGLLRESFQSSVAPLVDSLSGLVSAPDGVRPDIDALNDSLNCCLYESLDGSIGVKSGRPGHWKKYWTQEIEDAARERDASYSRWRWASGFAKVETWGIYQTALRRFRSLIQAAKRKSWNTFCSNLEKDFSKATAAIKRIKRNKESSATYSHPDGPAASVTAMASHLASVYNGTLLNSASRPVAPEPNVSDLPYNDPSVTNLFDADTIVSLIKRLPNGKAPGPDHLKAEMLKALASDIAPVLSLLFTLCSQWSYTPVLWRHAQVFPIYKKGDVSDPANFRPISLTSVMRKLFEFSLMPALDEHSPALDVAQGGFRPQRSPLDQALCLHDLMHDYFLTHHHYPVVAFLDIKSAYDTVDRNVIWDALAHSSLPRPILSLLINMFDDVLVSVLIANHNSDPFSPATGVLQGSVLSPHLYSLYINSLPAVLRAAVNRGTMVSPPGMHPVHINSLLFADDVAIFGSRTDVQTMLDVASDHSFSLGYRWKPSKCAVLCAPTASTRHPLSLYGEPLPVVEEFTYLGMPFRYKGLYAPGILNLRASGAIKTMALLNSVGVNRNGFSLLLCARLYKSFIRPKLEYGLAISHLSFRDFKALDALQNRLVGMFVGSTWYNVAKHLTCIPSMKHRYNVLATRYALRADTLPDDCLLVLLRRGLLYTRLDRFICQNPLYLTLPDPPPFTTAGLTEVFDSYWQDQVDHQLAAAAVSGTQTLLRACRRSVSRPDPILYLPIGRSARSRLVRWRLGRFTNMREECPCVMGDFISRNHFLTCRALDRTLLDALPVAPPGIHRIDYALNCLPVKASDGPPSYWSALLALLHAIDCLVHPLAVIPADLDSGLLWFSAR